MDLLLTTGIFLSAGLFMGWSLGANDAANIFGTAVGTRMIRFTTAAIICSIFVIIGAVVGGTGTSNTLGELGSINAIAGAFAVSASAAFTVLLMTNRGLPVSTSQAVVGAIIGVPLAIAGFILMSKKDVFWVCNKCGYKVKKHD